MVCNITWSCTTRNENKPRKIKINFPLPWVRKPLNHFKRESNLEMETLLSGKFEVQMELHRFHAFQSCLLSSPLIINIYRMQELSWEPSYCLRISIFSADDSHFNPLHVMGGHRKRGCWYCLLLAAQLKWGCCDFIVPKGLAVSAAWAACFSHDRRQNLCVVI